ncbi:gluconokinase [Oscillatoria laete-virens NRMC-F 0139]|nr:gluconokinase [Oscillatoria laete-virens NRMC-F 0139]
MIYIVMGVSGCGKSTVGKSLADKLGCGFVEGDAFHPEANVKKMSSGIPLTDDDRAGWLAALHGKIAQHLREQSSAVLSCSALKKKYRATLSGGDQRVKFIFLKVQKETLLARLESRQGHFMKENMLQSQLETLEEPTPEEAIIIDSQSSTEATLQSILTRLQPPPPSNTP